MDEQQTEALHQQASSLYLQGNLAQAVATWRELLDACPDDERAAEGIRLCESMMGGTSERIDDGTSPFAVDSGSPARDGGPPGAPAAAAAPGEDPEALKETLDNLLDLGSPPPSAVRPAEADDGLLDLSELKDETDEPAFQGFGAPGSTSGSFGTPEIPVLEPEPESDSSEGSAVWRFGDTPGAPPADDPLSPMHAASGDAEAAELPTELPGSAAEVELRRRVNQLLSEALMSVENGHPEEALRTLDRLLILDEHNEPALSLREKIRAGTGADVERDASPDAELETIDLGMADDGFDREDPMSPGSGDGPAFDPVFGNDAPDPEPERDLDPDPSDELRARDADGSGTGSGPKHAAASAPNRTAADLVRDVAPVARSRRFAFRLPSMKVVVPLALLAAAGLGWLGWSWIAGPDANADDGTAVNRPVKRPPTGGNDPALPPDGQPNANDPDPAIPEAERLAASIARADAALARADYAVAIIAFNEALAIDPTNDVLRRRMDEAAEQYRVQQKELARWVKARQDFEKGAYSEALAFYYRLPPEHQSAEIQRYKLNGWYNLGVVALQGGSCDEAKEHLREAGQISPDDPQVRAALTLADRCLRGQIEDFETAVARLDLRALDD